MARYASGTSSVQASAAQAAAAAGRRTSGRSAASQSRYHGCTTGESSSVANTNAKVVCAAGARIRQRKTSTSRSATASNTRAALPPAAPASRAKMAPLDSHERPKRKRLPKICPPERMSQGSVTTETATIAPNATRPMARRSSRKTSGSAKYFAAIEIPSAAPAANGRLMDTSSNAAMSGAIATGSRCALPATSIMASGCHA